MKLTYSQDLIKSAADRYFRHQLGWRLPLLTLLLLGSFATLEISGRHPTLSGLIGLATNLPIVIMCVMFLRTRRSALEDFSEIRNDHVELILEDQKLRLSSDSLSVALNSTQDIIPIQERDFWLLVNPKGGHTTVPLLNLDSAQRSDIEAAFQRFGWSA